MDALIKENQICPNCQRARIIDKDGALFCPLCKKGMFNSARLGTTIKSLETKIVALNNDKEELQQIIDEQGEKPSALVAENSEQDEKIKKMMGIIESQDRNISTLDGKVSEQAKKISDLEGVIDDKNVMIDEKNTTINEQGDKISEMEDALVNQKKTIVALEKKLKKSKK